ncbi:MAG: hypothetical protein RLZZ156_816 [Deinococcota bacterium]|jgi:uncharacterized protein YPO0396
MKKRRGFRLEKFEVYNWGTFNHHVWSLEVNGGTALLVGANGSGKSTLVDAFLTLLVSSRQRNYNQASGDVAKRERNETSYVRGAYKRTTEDNETSSSIRYLRDKDNYSVLLAQFKDAPSKEVVSLAAVFYWAGNANPEHFYLVAGKPLSIAADFRLDGEVAGLKKRLRSQGASLYDEFKKYSLDFIKRFGLRSDKALDLFNQTVSIKEITGLNEFVRSHMLEKPDTDGQIRSLREQFENLSKAHDAILKAQQQIDLLQPMMQHNLEFLALQEKMVQAEKSAEATKFYFAQCQLDLRTQAVQAAQMQLEALEQQRQEIQISLEQEQNTALNLKLSIQNDDVGKRLSELQREMDVALSGLQLKKRKMQDYNLVLNQLDLAPIGQLEEFMQLRGQANREIQNLEKKLEESHQEWIDAGVEASKLRTILQDLRSEIDSLKSRQSNIPRVNLQIRTQMASALAIPEDNLPFAGELIQVKSQDNQWEGAIERLLNPLGKQLLVPENLYGKVSNYVNQTHLRGRLVYLRTLPHRGQITVLDETNLLIHKLEVKPSHPMQSWLRQELQQRWDYVCCESIEQFKLERRALSLSGQIKHNENRHEKDDRSSLGDAREYVLGWSNQDKIKALENEFSNAAIDHSTALGDIEHLKKSRETLIEAQKRWQRLLAFEHFQDLDWQPHAIQLEQLTAQHLALEAQSNHLAVLQEQLRSCEARQKELEQQRQKSDQDLGGQKRGLAEHQAQIHKLQKLLAEIPSHLWQAFSQTIATELRGKTIDLENAADLLDSLKDSLTKRSKSYLGQANGVQKRIEETMSEFCRRFAADSTELDATIASLAEYQRLLERLERDDLPKHREQFKEWLDDKITIAIKSFQFHLEKQEEDILESIKALNSALERIDYTPSTYIQLEAKKNPDVAIADFRNLLRACTPDQGQLQSLDMRQENFKRIKTLIERFSADVKWTEKVTDVRQWRVFGAREKYRESNKEKNYYEGSSGKSGGQKAKLAYTILASAIAYQYQLDKSNPKTFRFVVVDEAFSKSDEANSRYAMSLFEQLELQLLVVTPKDKTHVVEPFIQSCHFVINTPEEDNSQVYNLTLAEYESEKQRWKSED